MSDPKIASTTSPPFRCPFCGGTFQSMSVGGAHALAHSEPRCSMFDFLSPLEFVEIARRVGAKMVQ